MPAGSIPELLVHDAREWRRWLEAHHSEPAGVWLVVAKGRESAVTQLRHADALEEALACGWIDGQGRPRDGGSWFVRFTPRRPRSAWSKRNTQIIERLIREGRMHPAGLAQAERAKADGRWAAAYSGSMPVPDDLAAALAAAPLAGVNFERLTAQNRFAILYRLQAVKRAETRAARIDGFVAMLGRGETIHPQRAPLVRPE